MIFLLYKNNFRLEHIILYRPKKNRKTKILPYRKENMFRVELYFMTYVEKKARVGLVRNVLHSKSQNNFTCWSNHFNDKLYTFWLIALGCYTTLYIPWKVMNVELSQLFTILYFASFVHESRRRRLNFTMDFSELFAKNNN